jgi:hypothetical protein
LVQKKKFKLHIFSGAGAVHIRKTGLPLGHQHQLSRT